MSNVSLYSRALTSTELNIFIIPGVSQGYTLLAHFVCSEVPWVSRGDYFAESFPSLYHRPEIRGLFMLRINSFKFTVSAQAFSDELFFLCSTADKPLLIVAYLNWIKGQAEMWAEFVTVVQGAGSVYIHLFGAHPGISHPLVVRCVLLRHLD